MSESEEREEKLKHMWGESGPGHMLPALERGVLVLGCVMVLRAKCRIAGRCEIHTNSISCVQRLPAANRNVLVLGGVRARACTVPCCT